MQKLQTPYFTRKPCFSEHITKMLTFLYYASTGIKDQWLEFSGWEEGGSLKYNIRLISIDKVLP